MIYLWAQYLRRKGKLTGNLVVTTVMSNFGFEKQLASDGLQLIRAQVGDKYVLEQMLEAPGVALDDRVERHGDAHVVVLGAERQRQRSGDVAESAHLGERTHLGGREKYVQAESLRERRVGATYV